MQNERSKNEKSNQSNNESQKTKRINGEDAKATKSNLHEQGI